MRPFRSSAIIIASASLIGYALAFAYEAGFCAVYSVPPSLISLNLVSTLTVAGSLWFIVYSWIYANPLIWKFFDIKDEHDYAVWAWRLGLFVPGFVISVVFGLNFFLATLIGLGAWCLAFFVNKRPRAMDAAQNAPRLTSPPEYRLPPAYRFLALLLFCGLIWAFALGRKSSYSSPQYVAHVGHENMLLLKVYGDYLIAAPVQLQSDVLLVRHGLRIYKLGAPQTPNNFERRSLYSRLLREGWSATPTAWDLIFPWEQR